MDDYAILGYQELQRYQREENSHFPLMTNSYRTNSEMMKDEIAELRFMGRKVLTPQRERQESAQAMC